MSIRDNPYVRRDENLPSLSDEGRMVLVTEFLRVAYEAVEQAVMLVGSGASKEAWEDIRALEGRVQPELARAHDRMRRRRASIQDSRDRRRKEAR